MRVLLRSTLFTLLFSAFLGAHGPLLSAVALDSEVLWGKDEGGYVFFVPQSYFEKSSLSSSDLPHADVRALEGEISWATAPPTDLHGRERALCHPGRKAAAASASAPPLPEYLQTRPVVVLGQVVDIQNGWGGVFNEVSQAAFVEVDEVIRDETGRLGRGDTVVFRQRGGMLWIDGVELCREPDEGSLSLESGLRVLLAGGLHEGSGAGVLLMDVPAAFAVTDNLVRAQPTASVQPPDGAGWDLADLRHTLQHGEGSR